MGIPIYNQKTGELRWIDDESNIDTESPRAQALEGHPFRNDLSGIREQQMEEPVRKSIRDSYNYQGLSHAEEVKKRIKERTAGVKEASRKMFTPKGWGEMAEEAKQHPFKTAFKNLVPAFGLGAQATLPRLEAMLANPALAAQEGETNILKLGFDSLRGLAGNKVGEFGDVYLRALPEQKFRAPQVKFDDKGAHVEMGTYDLARPEAAILGLGTVAAATEAGGRLYNRLTSRGARWTAKDDAFVKQQSKEIHEAIKETRAQVKDNYNILYSRIDDTPVDMARLHANLIKRGIPKDVADDIVKQINDMAVRVDPVSGASTPDTPTVSTLRDVRYKIFDEDIAVQDLVRRAYFKDPGQATNALDKVADTMKDTILEVADEPTRKAILANDTDFKVVTRQGGSVIRQLYDAYTETYKGTLRGINRKGADSLRAMLRNLNEFNSKVGDAMFNMQKYIGRQQLKKQAGRAVKYGVLLKAVHDVIQSAAGKGASRGMAGAAADIHAGT